MNGNTDELSRHVLASIRIHNLINHSFGGIITKKEWENKYIEITTITYNPVNKQFSFNTCSEHKEKSLLAFRSLNLAMIFAENNTDIINDYFMKDI